MNLLEPGTMKKIILALDPVDINESTRKLVELWTDELPPSTAQLHVLLLTAQAEGASRRAIDFITTCKVVTENFYGN